VSDKSLADTFIAIMADLRAIDPASDDPMRYAARGLRSEAEQIIGNALHHAQQLAYSARQLQRDCKDAIKEAVDAANPSTESQK
jgi:hypothetical protein